jgi:hypothetical protein
VVDHGGCAGNVASSRRVHGPSPRLLGRNCQSQLRRIEGVDLLEGPPGIALSIRTEAEVMTGPRQNCQNKVRGGIVVATVKDVPAKVSATLTYRVRYDTDEGPKQSTHTRQVTLFP